MTLDRASFFARFLVKVCQLSVWLVVQTISQSPRPCNGQYIINYNPSNFFNSHINFGAILLVTLVTSLVKLTGQLSHDNPRLR